MMHNLFKAVETRRLTIDGTNYILAAGTTDVNSGAVDTKGFYGVAFVLTMGIISASGAVSVKVQQSDDDGSSDAYSDILGTAQGATADTDDNKTIIVEIYKPLKRYVRLVTTRGDGGNSVIDALHAFLFHPLVEPVAQGATNFGAEFFNSPAEGSA